MAIFGILALGGITDRERAKKKKAPKRDDVNIRYRGMPDPPESQVFATYLGGARFYCQRIDFRCFVGFVMLVEGDEVPRIYRNDMTMLGHIPREHLEDYLRWSGGETFPCVGFVKRGATSEELRTELRIIKPFNPHYVESEMKRFVSLTILSEGNDMKLPDNSYEPVLVKSKAATPKS